MQWLDKRSLRLLIHLATTSNAHVDYRFLHKNELVRLEQRGLLVVVEDGLILTVAGARRLERRGYIEIATD